MTETKDNTGMSEECANFFEIAFEHHPMQTIAVNLEGVIVAVNRAKRNSGDRAAEKGMKMYVDYAAGHDIDMFAELLKVMQGTETVTYPMMAYRDKILDITITPTPYGALIISADVTQRIITEQKLKRSEERFRLLVEQISCMAIQGYKLDGTITYWNKASEKLYGYHADEVIGDNLLETIIPPGMREDVKLGMDFMIKSGEPIPSGELALMRKDGTLVTVFSSHALLCDHNGDSELFCVDIDLTEQKKAEDLLRKNEALLRALTEAAQDAIIAMNEEGKIFLWNPAAQRMLGYSCGEVIGQPLHECIAPEDYREMSKKGIEQFIQTGEGAAIGKTTDQRALHKDGHVIDVQLSLSRLPMENGWGSVGILRDVTEQKLAERALRESEERLRVVSMTDQLTGLYNRWHFSHELQREVDRSERYGQPLSVIMFDIDDFKQFNEIYGHAAGDRVLQILGHVVKGSMRKSDIACRIGGEEFFIILPMTSRSVAQTIAFRISTSLKMQSLDFALDKKITFSCGVCQYTSGQSPDDLSRRVDQLMRQAKSEGKDRIICDQT